MSETTRSLIVMLRANTQPFSEGLRSAEASLSALKGNAAKLSADFRNQLAAAGNLSADERERRRIQQQFEQGLEKIGRLRNLDVETGKQLVVEAEKLRAIQMQAVDDRASEERRRAAWEASEAAAKISAQLREQQGLLAAATEFERERLTIATRHVATLERIKSAPGLDEGTRGRLESQAETLRMAQLADVNRREAAKAAAETSARDRQRAAELQGQADAATRVSTELKSQLALTTATTAAERAKLLAEQQYVANLERINALKGIDRVQTQAMIADAQRLRAAQLEAAKNAGAEAPLGGLGSIFGNSARARTMLRGAGALLAYDMIADRLAAAGKEASNLSQQFIRGEKDAASLAKAAWESVPAVGTASKAMSSIADGARDAAAATAKWLGYSRETQRWLMSDAALTADIAKQAAETEKRWAAGERMKAIFADLQRQREALRELTPLQRERNRIEDEYAKQIATIRAEEKTGETPAASIRAALEVAEQNRRAELAKAESAPLLEKARERAKEAKQRIEDLQAERREIGKTAAEIAYMRAIREKHSVAVAEAIKLNVEMNEKARASQDAIDLAKTWKQQADTLRLTNEELEIYKLRLAGASEEALKAAEAARKQLEAARLAKDVFDLGKNFEEQRALLGKNADQAAILKLQLRGANEEQLKGLRAEAQRLELAREQQKEADRLKQKAEGLKEATRTPFEAFKKEMADLDAMLKAKLINDETYRRAEIEARKTFRAAADQKRGESIERGPGMVLADSAEAYRLMYAGKSEEIKTQKDQLKTQERIARANEQMLAEQRKRNVRVADIRN